MESTMKRVEFDIKNKTIKIEGTTIYEPVMMVKGQHISDKTFEMIRSAMAGVLPDYEVRGKPAIKVGLRTKDGKTELLGVVISEEGDYPGKRDHLQEFRRRASDIHVSVGDPLATHYRITYGAPTEDIRRELLEILNDKFQMKHRHIE